MLIIEKIKSTDLSSSEHTIAQYMINQRESIQHLTLKQIAANTHTSPSTFVRLAQKLGYSGWNELKLAYLGELDYLNRHFKSLDANTPFNGSDSMLTIAHKVAQLQEESILDTLSLLNHEDLLKAVDIMKQHNSILMYGAGSVIILMETFQHQMSRIKKRVELPTLQDEQIYNANLADASDCAIIVSYSGETPFSVKIAEILKERGITIIAITSIGENSLSKIADCTLRITTREKSYSKIGTFTSHQSIYTVLNMLYACYFSTDYDVHWDNKVLVSKRLESSRQNTTSIIDDDLPL